MFFRGGPKLGLNKLFTSTLTSPNSGRRESRSTDWSCLLTGTGLLFSLPVWNIPVELRKQVPADEALVQDPEKRRPVLRDPIPPNILHAAPAEQFSLNFDVFARNLIELDGRATVLSIDDISAFDMMSRAAMLDGLHQVCGGDKAFLDR